MNNAAGIVGLLLLAVAAANFPFLTQRFLGVWGPVGKSLWLRLLELLVCYLLVGLCGLWLEQAGGQIAPQGWEFYVITFTLFCTLAFPGFVFRYLMKHHE
jgi:hypothetical protein